MTMIDKSLIDHALEITSGDRRRDYGRPLINHLRIALQWSNYLGVDITPEKVVWMMIGLKQAREAHTPKFDNLLDTVGYALCLDDMYAQLIEISDGIYAGVSNREEAMAYMARLNRSEMTSILEYLENLEDELSLELTIAVDPQSVKTGTYVGEVFCECCRKDTDHLFSTGNKAECIDCGCYNLNK